MANSIEFSIPEGYVLDTIKDGKVSFKKEASLPKTWDEWVKTHSEIAREYYIDNYCDVTPVHRKGRRGQTDANLLKSVPETKAVLALIKLIRLRDTYRDGWKPNWGDINELKYCIDFCGGKAAVHTIYSDQEILAFPSPEIRDEFFHNFKDLINEVKPLYN